MIEIKEIGKEECKLKRIRRRIKNNAKLNSIEIETCTHDNIVEYDFSVLIKSKLKRWTHFYFPYTVRFWGKLDKTTCVMTVGNVGEHLFDRIFAASKLLFEDIDDLTVVIEKDYC